MVNEAVERNIVVIKYNIMYHLVLCKTNTHGSINVLANNHLLRADCGTAFTLYSDFACAARMHIIANLIDVSAITVSKLYRRGYSVPF